MQSKVCQKCLRLICDEPLMENGRDHWSPKSEGPQFCGLCHGHAGHQERKERE